MCLDRMGKYRTILADPPWRYGNWGKASAWCRPNSTVRPMPYETMSVDEICALPVAELAEDDCDLYLWVTQRYMPEGVRVAAAWGFAYRQVLTWCKTPRGTGQGGLYCPTTEHLLLCRKGRMPKGKPRADSTWWQVKRPHNAHSRKPDVFHEIIEARSDPPRLELFARPRTPLLPRRPGWDVWGNEIESDVELVST